MFTYGNNKLMPKGKRMTTNAQANCNCPIATATCNSNVLVQASTTVAQETGNKLYKITSHGKLHFNALAIKQKEIYDTH